MHKICPAVQILKQNRAIFMIVFLCDVTKQRVFNVLSMNAKMMK